MLFFDNFITSRVESEHAQLKRALRCFTSDLKKMINVINLLLKNQRSDFLIAHEETKARVPQSCSIATLKNLRIFVSSYALRLIRKQYDKFMRSKDFNNSISLDSCTKTYQSFMRLSCAHVIERRALNDDLLQIENVHPH